MLNSLICLTLKPPYSLSKQTCFQPIHEIFICSSLPLQKKLFKRDSTEEVIPEGALKKERAWPGNEVNTNLRRIKQPPKERKQLFQPDNLDLMRF